MPRAEAAAVARERRDFCDRFCARQRFVSEFCESLEADEGRFGLRYRFAGGALWDVIALGRGCQVRVPDDLAAPVTDRRFLLDRANLVYGWLSRNPATPKRR